MAFRIKVPVPGLFIAFLFKALAIAALPMTLPHGNPFRNVVVFWRLREDCTRLPRLVHSWLSLNMSVSTAVNNANSDIPSRCCYCCWPCTP